MERFLHSGRQHYRMSLLMVFFVMAGLFFPVQSNAYFNRGTVSVSLGENSVSMTAGSVSSISVTIDPIKQDQLPGCGMAECPQTCGDGCLNESGECMCAGTEYHTYYSEVAVASSDASVASASYANGTLTIQGNAPGNATISVTGKLRQYTDSTATLPVTVNAKTSGGSSQSSSGSSASVPSAPRSYSHSAASSSSSAGTAASPSYTSPSPQQSGTGSDNTSGDTGEGSVIVEDTEAPVSAGTQEAVPEQPDTSGVPEETSTGIASVSPDPSAAEETVGAADSPKGELRNTARGKYRFVELTFSTDIPACFIDAASEGSHLVFQKKTGDNIDYSWTFNGENLKPEDDYSGLSLDISSSSSVPERLAEKTKGKNACFMNFKYSGELPDTAEIYINVTDCFSEDQDLFLYRVNKSNGKLTKINDHVEMYNGYASFTLDHCSDYILTDSSVAAGQGDEADSVLSAENRLGLPLVILLVLASGLGVFLILQYFRRRNGKGHR